VAGYPLGYPHPSGCASPASVASSSPSSPTMGQGRWAYTQFLIQVGVRVRVRANPNPDPDPNPNPNPNLNSPYRRQARTPARRTTGATKAVRAATVRVLG